MNDLSDAERHWYALYTRPRFEKKVDVELKDKGLESFLPLYSVVRLWSDRKKKIEEPLFPSYVFVHANLKERYLSLQTRGVVKMISFNGQPARIHESEIERLNRILSSGFVPEPHHYLKYGDEVKIISGPLEGLIGYFVEERGSGRLIISIHTIKQSVSIEVDRRGIKKVDNKQVKKPY